MKVVRIKLTQRIAHYRKEETIDNKMTYPLPPISTVIGALHNACGYKEYHSMNVSIQGKYGGVIEKVYYDSCFLNSLQNDRGCLVKMKNKDMLSNAFDIVAEAKKAKGSDFRKGITIQVFNPELLKEYRELKDMYYTISNLKIEKLNPFLEEIKAQKQLIKNEKAKCDDLEKVEMFKQKEKELIAKEKSAKDEFKRFEQDKYQIPISQFRTLTRGPKYYELLTDVELVLHISADDEVMKDIVENIGNFKALGRSEDFVDVEDCELVEVYTTDKNDDLTYENVNSAYIEGKLFLSDVNAIISGGASSSGIKTYGTRYTLNKDYKLKDNKRIFNKVSVIYTSDYEIESGAENLYIDKIDENKYYIVNLL